MHPISLFVLFINPVVTKTLECGCWMVLYTEHIKHIIESYIFRKWGIGCIPVLILKVQQQRVRKQRPYTSTQTCSVALNTAFHNTHHSWQCLQYISQYPPTSTTTQRQCCAPITKADPTSFTTITIRPFQSTHPSSTNAKNFLIHYTQPLSPSLLPGPLHAHGPITCTQSN